MILCPCADHKTERVLWVRNIRRQEFPPLRIRPSLPGFPPEFSRGVSHR